MINKNYINKDEGVSNKKQNDDIYKACKYSGKIFNGNRWWNNRKYGYWRM